MTAVYRKKLSPRRLDGAASHGTLRLRQLKTRGRSVSRFVLPGVTSGFDIAAALISVRSSIHRLPPTGRTGSGYEVFFQATVGRGGWCVSRLAQSFLERAQRFQLVPVQHHIRSRSLAPAATAFPASQRNSRPAAHWFGQPSRDWLHAEAKAQTDVPRNKLPKCRNTRPFRYAKPRTGNTCRHVERQLVRQLSPERRVL